MANQKRSVVRAAAGDSPACAAAKLALMKAETVVSTLSPIVAKANADAKAASDKAEKLQMQLKAAINARDAAKINVSKACPSGKGGSL